MSGLKISFTKNKIIQKEVERGFITPSIGRKFLFNNEFANELKSFEVYTTTGLLVMKNTRVESTEWDASYLPNGIYLVVARTQEGRVKTHKVIVR